MAAPAADADALAVKKIDLEVALSIAAMAGVPTRDKLGNFHDDIWTKFRDRSSLSTLLEPSDVRKMLLEQIRAQLEAKKELLSQVESNTVVCKWIITYTKAWETAYNAESQRAFDIGRKILSVMHETYYEVLEILDVSPLPAVLLYQGVAAATARAAYPRLLTSDDAIVRFLFRNDYTRFHMCRIAGKLLQKKEVCNRAGTYSATQQRNDITQEKDAAVKAFYHAVAEREPRFAECRALLESRALDYYLVDHSELTEP